MSKLSWNEIRQNAIKFSREWQDARDERAESQTFWNEFFDVFGVRRRTVAVFEDPVKTLRDTYHRIDLFWKGTLLAEHKSAGESFDKAQSQAFQYMQDLYTSHRQEEVPRWVVLSDFQRFALYDLEPEDKLELPLWRDHKYQLTEFQLADLHKYVKSFAFIIGQKTHRFGEEDPANLKAAAIMADLHDAVEGSGYTGKELERLLVRLLFCLFADDTGIFERTQFEQFLDNHTRTDGTDLGARLTHLFEVLNLPVDKRSKNLEEDLAAFPYINGELFAEQLHIASFNRDMRNSLRAACRFDWSRISPAVFGSLFQNILDDKERRQIGAHYTTERNILKVIRPLFLDQLRAEFDQIKIDRSTRREARLKEFHTKLSKLTFLDPACGCGNFLVIAYRELRRLELEILKLLHNFEGGVTELPLGELAKLSRIDVNQFYGIEIGEWAARIAETALWLTDHQMNMELTNAAGNLFQRIPLRAAPHIRCANALRLDWNELIPAKDCSFVLGNPPFVGKQYQTEEQKSDMRNALTGVSGGGVLDYVACWYFKAATYIGKCPIVCAFVSTNSITQGEQVGIIWSHLHGRGIHIRFAHRTFAWQSEARGAAHVHVVIVGFLIGTPASHRLFDYDNIKSDPREITVSTINPYLVDAPFVWVSKRRKPLCAVSPMNFGSMPNDGGFLTMTREEKESVLAEEPNLAPYIWPMVGSREFINGIERYCFWLVNVPSHVLKASAELTRRLKQVRKVRSESARPTTRDLALTPALFGEIRQPLSHYVAVPEVSSERRTYIPIGILPPSVIATNKIYQIPSASPFEFGVVQSAMHMAWTRAVAGRLKSDIQYSAGLVYNNFPWPTNPSKSQAAEVNKTANSILTTRQNYLEMGQSLADLYDPLYMPGPLLDAHHALDRAVDKCYRRGKFTSERERVEFLFTLYEKLTSPLAQTPQPTKSRRKKTSKR